jgi:hypothetical protein
VLKGHRMIVSAYCSQGVVDCCKRKKDKDNENDNEVQEEDKKRKKRNIGEAYREVTREDIGKWKKPKCRLQCKEWNLRSCGGTVSELQAKLRESLRKWQKKQENVRKSVN